MKKLLLTLAAAAVCMGQAFATPINVNDATAITGTEVAEKPAEGSSNGQARHYQPLNSLVMGDYTLTFSSTNTNASSQPAYYYNMSTSTNTQNTIRVYAQTAVTIKANNGTKLGKIVMNGSNGKADLTITANAGAAAFDSNTVIWSVADPVESVTLTFSGTFRINEIEFFEAGEEPSTPVDPGTTTSGANWDFLTGMCGFTFEQGTLPEGLSAVWTLDSQYGLKASAYNKGIYVSDAWAVSPVVDLTGAENPKLNFNYAANNFKINNEMIGVADLTKYVSVSVREENGQWVALTIPTLPESFSWSFLDSGDIDLSAYVGKKIQIGFRYTSTAECAGTWEIKKAGISGVEGGGTVTPPEPPVVTDYPLVVNDATEIDGEFIPEIAAGEEGSQYGQAAHFQPLSSLAIGDYYFSFSSTSDQAKQQPAFYFPMSTSAAGNSNIRVYTGSSMTISAPGEELMTAIAVDGSNADSGLTITADKGIATLESNKMAWSYEEGTNTVKFTFDKKYRMYGFNITLKSGSGVETVETIAAIYADGRNIVAPAGAEVYNMQGVRTGTENLAAGIYVVRAGKQVAKVLVK